MILHEGCELLSELFKTLWCQCYLRKTFKSILSANFLSFSYFWWRQSIASRRTIQLTNMVAHIWVHLTSTTAITMVLEPLCKPYFQVITSFREGSEFLNELYLCPLDTLFPRSNGTLTGSISLVIFNISIFWRLRVSSPVSFDQSQFGGAIQGIGPTGYLYVPKSCANVTFWVPDILLHDWSAPLIDRVLNALFILLFMVASKTLTLLVSTMFKILTTICGLMRTTWSFFIHKRSPRKRRITHLDVGIGGVIPTL